MNQIILSDIRNTAIGYWVVYNYNNRHNNIEWLDLLKYKDYDNPEVQNILEISRRQNISP